MTDIVAYVCHVLHLIRSRPREAGRAGAGINALHLHTGVTESSCDHVVLYSGGVYLHRVGSWVLKWPGSVVCWQLPVVCNTKSQSVQSASAAGLGFLLEVFFELLATEASARRLYDEALHRCEATLYLFVFFFFHIFWVGSC